MHTPTNHDRLLQSYGDLAVRIALNLQPGQRLFIIGPLANGGVSLDAAPFEVGISRIMALRCAERRASKSLEFIWFISKKWRDEEDGGANLRLPAQPRAMIRAQ